VLLTLVILAVPTVVYAWGRSSSSFDIAAVKVSGTRLVPEKKALRLLQQAYVGDNLFTVTAEDVRETLAGQSFVASVTVDREFPDTLAVGITEHVPAAYALAGSRWYVVDEAGYVVCTVTEAAGQLGGTAKAAKAADETGGEASPAPDASASATASADGAATGGADEAGKAGELTARLVAGPPGAPLPLPRIAASGPVRQGDVLADEPTVRKLTVITALPNSYRRTLAAVEEQEGLLTLRFTGGPVATWGDAERTLAKTVALRTVLRVYEEAGKTCTMVDVSLPDRTLARPVLQ
jgi:cell division septal protein FtsQ